MPTTAPLEDGLVDLEDLDAFPASQVVWDVGGLVLPTTGPLGMGVVYDEGLDVPPEVEGDDPDAAGDGAVMGAQRYASRMVTLGLQVKSGTDSDAFQTALDQLALITNLLPDRHSGVRLLRWRRKGADQKAWRGWYRPARGEALQVLDTNEKRLLYNDAHITIRLEFPDPIVYSDRAQVETWTTAATKTITNAGTFTAVAPTLAYDLYAEGPGGVTISHGDHDNEVAIFPSWGELTVTRRPGTPDLEIFGQGTYGLCSGPGGRIFPTIPALRPGDNPIHCNAPCELTWRHTR